MDVSVCGDSSKEREDWDGYVSDSFRSSIYHLYGWKDVVEQTFGHRTIYLAARTATGAIDGVLPLVELKSRLFGRILASLPFFNYGGVCTESVRARRLLIKEAARVAQASRSDFVELRQEEQWSDDLPVKQAKVAMRLDLPESTDALWKMLGAKLRNQIQKPRKEGMQVVFGGLDLVDAFYGVFSANMRDLGTPVYPKSLFANILRRFPGNTWIAVVLCDGAPVAAGFLTGFKHRLEIPWASSLRAFNRRGPNMLLYWSCLEFAIDRGFSEFDFGRSTPGAGTFRFKEQWGARPHPLFWYYWLPRGGAIPEVNPANPRYRTAIAIWRQLPLAVTHWLGPQIVKYIP